MSNADLDTGIPLLTEIVAPAGPTFAAPSEAQAAALPISIQPAEPPPEAPRVVTAPVDPPTAALSIAAQPTRIDTAIDETAAARQLEHDIATRVLQQLMSDVDAILEPRMRDSLSELLEAASTVLAAEIRQTLQTTLGEVVSTAVAQELEKHRFEKAKNN